MSLVNIYIYTSPQLVRTVARNVIVVQEVLIVWLLSLVEGKAYDIDHVDLKRLSRRPEIPWPMGRSRSLAKSRTRFQEFHESQTARVQQAGCSSWCLAFLMSCKLKPPKVVSPRQMVKLAGTIFRGVAYCRHRQRPHALNKNIGSGPPVDPC